MTRILVVGGVSLDNIIYLDQLPPPRPHTVFSKGYHETVGSTGAGKALTLNRLRLDVTLHAMLGADPAGDTVRDYFAHEGLRFLYDIDPQGTERHVNLMDDAGDRLSIYVSHATFEPEFDRERLEREIARCDLLVLNIINYCRHLIPLARKYNKPIWCDIHDYDGENPYHQDFVDAADVLFMSGDALPDHRVFMQQMIASGKQLAVCTQGRNGSIVLTGEGQWLHMPALEYPQVDTNGAGDAFFAGYLYGYLQEYAQKRCLQLATITGGLTVTSREIVFPELGVQRLEKEWQARFGP